MNEEDPFHAYLLLTMKGFAAPEQKHLIPFSISGVSHTEGTLIAKLVEVYQCDRLQSPMSSCDFLFRGFMAPVFTPFNHDQEKSLNLSVIPEYAKYLATNGILGVLVNGTSGEATSQTVEEREQVAEAWIEACRSTGQIVMVQVGGTSLTQVQRLASHAERHGASAILCLADLFHRPKTPKDLIHYLKLVSRHAPKTPLLYYHLPDFTGINVNMNEFLQEANQIPNFAGIKFTSNDVETGSRCLTIEGGKYAIFLGSDTMLLPAFAMGFNSVIGTTLNMMAAGNFDVYLAVRRGDLQSAMKSQKKLTSAIACITKYGSWVETMKSAMNLLTPIRVGPVREPLSSLSEGDLHSLREELKLLQIGHSH